MVCGTEALKGCGPKGYPGMPEVGNMPLPTKLLEKGVRTWSAPATPASATPASAARPSGPSSCTSRPNPTSAVRWPSRGYAKLHIDQVRQADKGCDLDVLVGPSGSVVTREPH
ncbi:MAG: hypothetical protein WAL33_05180 [Caulobacter sp.]